MHQTLKWIGFVSVGLLGACASTHMREVHRQPDFQSTKIHHVLVIGHFKNQDLRKTIEMEFVRQWSAYGVKADSSIADLPSTTPLNKIAIESIAKAEGFDAVLVCRLLNKKKIAAGKPASPYVIAGSSNDIQSTPTVSEVLLAPPVAASDYELSTVESSLYDVLSERRVWSGISETKEIKAIPKLLTSFVKLILKRLYESPH